VTKRSQDRLRVGALSGNNFGQVVHTRASVHQAVYFDTGQRAVMPCGWQSNRRSGIALAMHHGLSGLSTYGLNGQRMGDEHPAYAPDGAWPGLTFDHGIATARVHLVHLANVARMPSGCQPLNQANQPEPQIHLNWQLQHYIHRCQLLTTQSESRYSFYHLTKE